MNTHYKSSEFRSKKTASEIMDWLMNPANHKQLMPAEITEFTSDGNKMRYNLGGLANLELEITKKDSNTIEIHPLGNVPFAFLFYWKITQHEDGSTIQSFLDAELNFIFKMAAGSKLNKLITYQAERLQEISDATAE